MTSSETTFNDEELIARLRYLTRVTRDYDQGDMIAADYAEMPVVTKEAADRIEELLAERKKDHANINLKADFIDKTINQLAEADAKLAKALEALLWCSGSADFNEGGVAREGWLKVCAPLLKGESHDPL